MIVAGPVLGLVPAAQVPVVRDVVDVAVTAAGLPFPFLEVVLSLQHEKLHFNQVAKLKEDAGAFEEVEIPHVVRTWLHRQIGQCESVHTVVILEDLWFVRHQIGVELHVRRNIDAVAEEAVVIAHDVTLVAWRRPEVEGCEDDEPENEPEHEGKEQRPEPRDAQPRHEALLRLEAEQRRTCVDAAAAAGAAARLAAVHVVVDVHRHTRQACNPQEKS